jgi:hypothetical protein
MSVRSWEPCTSSIPEWTAKINSQEYLVQSMRKGDPRSIAKPQKHRKFKITSSNTKNKCTHFECVEYDIQFDGVLSADGVINLACVGKRNEDED